MTKHHSSLGILQDPLLMLLALMLLGSLPFILPSGPAPEGPPIDDQAVARLEQELAELEAAHLDLIVRRGWRAGHVQTPSSDAQLTGRLQALRARIAKLSGLLERVRAEASTHEAVLERWAAAADGDLQTEIGATRVEIRVLKERHKHLQEFVATRSGLPIYSTEGSSGRTAILAEAVESRLYLIDTRNYWREASDLPDGGEAVSRIRKPKAQGEDSGALHSGHSIWYTELSGLDPNEHYVFVWVREDGFRVFLQARLIAQRLGFPVGWDPLGSGPISYRSGSGYGPGDRTPDVTGGQY